MITDFEKLPLESIIQFCNEQLDVNEPDVKRSSLLELRLSVQDLIELIPKMSIAQIVGSIGHIKFMYDKVNSSSDRSSQ